MYAEPGQGGRLPDCFTVEGPDELGSVGVINLVLVNLVLHLSDGSLWVSYNQLLPWIQCQENACSKVVNAQAVTALQLEAPSESVLDQAVLVDL